MDRSVGSDTPVVRALAISCSLLRALDAPDGSAATADWRRRLSELANGNAGWVGSPLLVPHELGAAGDTLRV